MITQAEVEATQGTLFDYGALDEHTRVFVQEKAQAIHARLKRTAEDIIAIGQDLIAVKERLGHGQFVNWLASEFDLTRQSAANFMRVAQRFGQTECKTVLHLPIRVLYELASSSTPDTIIEMVESGDIPATLPAIREAKREIHGHSLPSTWGLVNGKPFDMPLPDGKPIESPQEWKLPSSLRDGSAPSSSTIEQVEKVDSTLQPVIDVRSGQTIDWMSTTPDDDTLQQGIDLESEEVEQRLASPEDEVKDRRDAHVMRVMGSSDSPEWYTPQKIVQLSMKLLGKIDLDPCSNSHDNPNVPAECVYTKEDDGLAQKWSGKTYLNPPYGAEIGKWVDKLIYEYEHGQVDEAIALLPARIDTNWFLPLYEYAMCNVHGRIQFENSPYHAPFPCVIVYLGKRTQDFIDTFKDRGPIMRRIG